VNKVPIKIIRGESEKEFEDNFNTWEKKQQEIVVLSTHVLKQEGFKTSFIALIYYEDE
jgi:hypothetical protein